MTKSLILHIGWRKTGSSALQELIFGNTHDHALQHLGIVPAGQVLQNRVIGARVGAHHGLGGLAFRDRCERAWNEVKPFVDSVDFDEFLITSEIFSSHVVRGAGHYDRLAQYLSIFDHVRVLCWIRRQDEYTASLAVQAAKHGGTGRERGDREPMNWPKDADYSDVLEKISAVLPNAEIAPQLYLGPASDVVDDGIKLLGLDRSGLTIRSSARVNARASPEMYRVQIEVNRRAKARGVNTGPLQRILLAAAGNSENYSTLTRPAVPFTHEHRQRIIDRHRVSNARLCKTYDLDSGYFEPSAAELAKLPGFNIPDRVPVGFSKMLADGIEANRSVKTAAAIEFIRGCLDEITCLD